MKCKHGIDKAWENGCPYCTPDEDCTYPCPENDCFIDPMFKLLFIPLKKEFYDAFKDGSKTWELRGNYGQFKSSRIVVGRRARLARGYGYPRLMATVMEFHVYNDLDDIPPDIWNNTVPPHLRNQRTTVDLATRYHLDGFTLMRMQIDEEIDS